ncbi:SDR family NAD(P)-dependent oxidoreductase [Flaviflexus huanghaiensis]|uniref:SDR family NAD(P)-dependent oxidoreductase n=1 Tax=Flaviflexus huanghaiensis TaxID=1111473 RepID=UPI0015F954FF|nr:SDR family NAD(P)-dependent oxidoreductase [Flaviflexus huanghaiensis]
MKTLFLTGASRGVGAALADRLADSWRLILLARNEDSAAELQARHPRASIIAGNLSQESAARSITESIDTMLGDDGLDAFVSCAGIEGAAPLEKTTDEFLRQVFSVNVLSPVLLTRGLLPRLRQARGTVVYVGSTAAHLDFSGWLPYSTSKAALEKAAAVLRSEERAIRVSTVTPGRIDTDMQRDMAEKELREFDPSTAMSPDSVAWAIEMALEAPSDLAVDKLTITPHS